VRGVGAERDAALLAQEAVVGIGLGEDRLDRLLGADVGDGEGVGRAVLVLDLQGGDLGEVLLQAVAGGARRADHGLDQGGRLAHDQSLSLVRHRLVARVRDRAEAPIQNRMAGPKS
jgi:hypothetical protein